MAAQPVRLIVAGAGPLIVLSRMDQLGILQALFSRVAITNAVHDELFAGGNFPGQSRLASAITDWIDRVMVEMGAWEPANPDLGAGEASSIYLAENSPGSLLLIDDAAGRREAASRGLHYVGMMGVVLEAKRHGHIARARPLLESFRKEGFYLRDDLFHKALAAVGEGNAD